MSNEPPAYPPYPGPEGAQPGQQSPPPPGYGQAPPPGYGQPPSYAYGQVPPAYGAGFPTGPAPFLASWWSRVGAYLLDGLILLGVILVPLVIGLVLTFKDSEIDPVTDEISNVGGAGILVLVLTALLYLAFDIWNRVFRQGTMGQSLGKKVVGIQVVRAAHGDPIGVGAGFGRWGITLVMGFVPFVSFIIVLLDYLWPLWDDKNQSLHDKVVSSIVIRTS